jgi:hypothetical protein
MWGMARSFGPVTLVRIEERSAHGQADRLAHLGPRPTRRAAEVDVVAVHQDVARIAAEQRRRDGASHVRPSRFQPVPMGTTRCGRRCGAATVHAAGRPCPACVIPVGSKAVDRRLLRSRWRWIRRSASERRRWCAAESSFRSPTGRRGPRTHRRRRRGRCRPNPLCRRVSEAELFDRDGRHGIPIGFECSGVPLVWTRPDRGPVLRCLEDPRHCGSSAAFARLSYPSPTLSTTHIRGGTS